MLYLQTFTFNVASENTYILYNDQKNAWLFDPGNSNEKETAMLEKFIADQELVVTKIILTHAHFDHVMGLQWAYDTFQVPVLLHPAEKEILEMLSISAGRFGLLVKPVNVELSYLEEGDVLNFDGDEFQVYHVPGHSPGSLVFHHKKEKFMISGDVLFQGSIGRTELYKGDFDLLISGIQSKLMILDPETQVFSGHGAPTHIGFEKQFNPFL